MSALAGKAFNARELQTFLNKLFGIIARAVLEGGELVYSEEDFSEWKRAFSSIDNLKVAANRLVAVGDNNNYGPKSPIWRELDAIVSPLNFSASVRELIAGLPKGLYIPPEAPYPTVSRSSGNWEVIAVGSAVGACLAYLLLRKR